MTIIADFIPPGEKDQNNIYSSTLNLSRTPTSSRVVVSPVVHLLPLAVLCYLVAYNKD